MHLLCGSRFIVQGFRLKPEFSQREYDFKPCHATPDEPVNLVHVKRDPEVVITKVPAVCKAVL